MDIGFRMNLRNNNTHKKFYFLEGSRETGFPGVTESPVLQYV
jgi:hypothetical protein